MSATKAITGSMLYDFTQCVHRPFMDAFGDPSLIEEPDPFVQLLWERGIAHENRAMAGHSEHFTDLSGYKGDEKERKTREAMGKRDRLIYSGRICDANLVGEPDLMRLEGDGYIAGDIKSGAAEEGSGEGSKLKKHYAMQLAIYTDILERIEMADYSRKAFIWDKDLREVIYDLGAPQGPRNKKSFWDDYLDLLAFAESIVSGKHETRPALAAPCKLCHWGAVCRERVEKEGDLTLIPELGRAKRDVLASAFGTISSLASADISKYVDGGKTKFSGIGPDSLSKFQERAQLLANTDGRPYLKGPVNVPVFDTEIFFDIEVDPLRDICYLHGFVERRNGAIAPTYRSFFADTPNFEGEKIAFRDAVNFLNSLPANHHIYYYSSYERTWWRNLQERHPEICSPECIEALFSTERATDLYTDVVRKLTEWPTYDHSIKTLAKYLGFSWRDAQPSGAASIEWYSKWAETNDPAIKNRILEYNEDDCHATAVVLDGIRALKPRVLS